MVKLAAGCRLDYPGEPDKPLGISLGLAVYPSQAITAAALLTAADQALYRSKAQSRR